MKRNSTAQNKKAALAALGRNAGSVTAACKAAKVSRGNFYVWVKEDEEFAKAVQDVHEGLKDLAESKLHAAIKKGSPWAICFYLKCQAKDRGYVERREMEHSGSIGLADLVAGSYKPDAKE